MNQPNDKTTRNDKKKIKNKLKPQNGVAMMQNKPYQHFLSNLQKYITFFV